ncbi:MAG: phosphoribosylformylglycinamidine cyclo-ligase [Lachnospiraceae bacterium]|nr:phosphoribosylformylglycinamidine cyclo-ligase [Lachnospiraceae bacterium]
MSMDYKQAGVDIEAGYESVERIKAYVKRTLRPEVLGGLGGFSGAFSVAALKQYEDPILLSGTDGVGTKLQLAFLMDRHDTVGIDCVAMCVNDVICAGGKPLFFLDYIACGRNDPAKIEAIVAGVAEGCVQAGCALIGGETAEHPGLMPEEEYDLAGFAVGAVERRELIDGSSIRQGDALIGVFSSGVHSNGFSLIRRAFPMTKERLLQKEERLGGRTLGETLLTPTRIYVRMYEALKASGIHVKGMSHITGGGFYENIPRMLPDGCQAVIDMKSYRVPEIFRMIAEAGDVEERVMYNTYNMGIGMVLALESADAERALAVLREAGEDGVVLGQIETGEKGVKLC